MRSLAEKRKIGEAFIRVRPDLEGFAHEAEPHAKEGGLSFGKIFSANAAAELVSSGIEKIVEHLSELITGSIEKAREAAKVERITAAAIKSTGGAAGLTAEQVAELAEKEGRLVGVQHDIIQAGENLLLTFTKVKNAAGEGNDIFDQATAAIVDMTAAMNHGVVNADGLKTATIQVGKALQDPINGMTALRRVGVTFDESQQKQIKSLVAAGKQMQAQKLILKELRTEFGGVAAASADPAQRASVAWGEFQEKLGKMVLPTVNKLLTAFTDRVVPYLEERVIPGIKRVANGLKEDFGPAIQTTGRWIGTELLPRLRVFGDYMASKIIPVVRDVGHRLRVDGAAAIKTIGNAIREHRPQLEQLLNAFKRIGAFIMEKVLPVLGPLLSFTLKTIAFQIKILVDTIAALVMAFNWIVRAAKATWNWLVSAWNAVTGFVGGIVDFFRTARAAYDDMIKAIKQKISDIIDSILGIPGKIKQLESDFANSLVNAGKNIVEGLWNGISSMGGWLVDKLKEFVSEHVPGPFRKILQLGSPSRLFAGFGRDTIRGYWGGVKTETANTRAAMNAAPPADRGLGAMLSRFGAGGSRGDINITATADNKMLAALIAMIRFTAQEVVDTKLARMAGGRL